MESLLSYKFQSHVSHVIGTLSPIYRPAIHWKNQNYYSLLGMSAAPNVIVGRDRQLSRRSTWTTIARATWRVFTPRRRPGPKNREMEDFFEARGKTFLAVITPSKPAIYPEALPAGLNCPSKPYDRQHKVAVYRQMLDRNGVHYPRRGDADRGGPRIVSDLHVSARRHSLEHARGRARRAGAHGQTQRAA